MNPLRTPASRPYRPWLIAIACSLVGFTASPAQGQGSRADWLREAGHGVFMHFLPSVADGPKAAAEFDVEALAGQLERAGAKYFVLTLGQNSGFFNAPNAAYDRRARYAPGERCAIRDLPLEMSRVLAPRGIRLMLYLPCQPPNEDRRAQEAFGLKAAAGDQHIDEVAAKEWAKVIGEWAERYGDRVSGWWFDGGYEWIGFDEKIAAIYAEAVRRGNPRAIVTFNPGVKLARWTRAEDYTAGELNDPFDVRPTSRFVDGSQWHALTFLGSHWGARDARFPAARWAEWIRAVNAGGGAVTLDAGPNYDPKAGPVGAISEAQMQQLEAIARAIPRDHEKGR
ncbi:Alpha-L-fucosidase [Aquisphaera giovannonii]|uniref:Alpha-L-fucosidase n=1 Tax=Aquisphaera giovannonii TaxID=406548 RepID=A0A5B9W4A0_9BACT|nr:alpha-L-fucosidase [Aquisphaera giovannonii]QEH35084.1 Alpha-L-fucosidase [Aquisphaera giovannonii]